MRTGVIVLAALAVVLIGWFLLSRDRAPGEETPSSADRIAARIRDAHVPDAEAASLLEELASASTVEAQAALTDLAGDERLAPGRREGALLALGTLGRRVREPDPDRERAVSRTIEEALRQAPSDAARIAALRAYANLGPGTVPEPVASLLQAQDPAIRAAAVEAVLRVPEADVDRTLVRLARSDAESTVRLAALETLVRRQEEELAAPGGLDQPLVLTLEDVAEEDPEEVVRAWATDRLPAETAVTITKMRGLGDYRFEDLRRVYQGHPPLVHSPCVVSADAVYARIPAYQEILRRGLSDTKPRYHFLMRDASRAFTRAVRAVARHHHHDAVVEIGTIVPVEPGVESPPDRTQEVIQELSH